MAFDLGELIRDRYKINRRLGSANWGVTYLATDLQAQNSQDSKCIIQEIKLSKNLTLAANKDYLAREVKALKTLGRSSQIPSLRDYFIIKEKFYLVQEFIDGTLLACKIKPGNRLPEDKVIKLLIDLLKIVRFISDNQYIHRNLKLDNIIQRDNGEIVITNFGTVKEINLLHQTNSGDIIPQLIGTLPYIAPERFVFPRPKEFDTHPRIDIYSLGIIGLQAITGLAPDSLPIDPHNDGARLWSDAISVSPRMKSILNKMAHPNHQPGYRYQNANEVLEDLRIKTRERKVTFVEKARTLYSRQISFGSLNIPAKFTLILLSLAFIVGLFKQCSQPNIDSQYSKNNPEGVVSSLENSPQQSDETVRDFSLINSKQVLAQFTQTTNDLISSGEEILNRETAANSLKIQATQLYSQGKYLEAAKVFKEYWNAGNKDPEALIYLNNALIESTAAQYYTIAVVVPFPDNTASLSNNFHQIGEEILRGVAKAQEEANLRLFTSNWERENFSQLPNIETLKQKILQGKRLKIIIATDYNNKQQGKQIATQLSKFPALLGVISHYQNDITREAIKIYNDNQITLISPTSNSVKLTNSQRPFFFRTIPSVEDYAETLVEHLIDTLDVTEVAIFYDSEPQLLGYSYWQEFKTRFENNQGKVILASDNLNSPQFNPRKAIKAIDREPTIKDRQQNSKVENTAEKKQQKELAIVLFPDTQGTASFSNAQKIIQLNNNQHWIVGAETLYNSQTIKLHQSKLLEKVAIATPWHYSPNIKSNFITESQNIWREKISYRTAYAYDATRVFIQALAKTKVNNPTSKDLQKIISHPNFSSQGATGTIEFTATGNREGKSIELVTVNNCESQAKVFVTLDNQQCF